jgi:hypothetical protein
MNDTTITIASLKFSLPGWIRKKGCSSQAKLQKRNKKTPFTISASDLESLMDERDFVSTQDPTYTWVLLRF